MCPFCFATAAWIAVGITSTGGISALAISALRRNQRPDNRNQEQGESDGQEH